MKTAKQTSEVISKFAEYECKHCGYTWHPKKVAVKCCPRCKSYKWAEPKPKAA